MGWSADQIYLPPHAQAIQLLRAQPLLRSRLFLVNDHRGIRSTHTRARPYPPQLPPDGLLAVAPIVYETGYDASPEDFQFFASLTLEEDRSQRWEGLQGYSGGGFPVPELPHLLDSPVSGLCRHLSEVASSPVLFYYSDMSGGDVDAEVVWLFEPRGESLWFAQGDRVRFWRHGIERPDGIGNPLAEALRHLQIRLQGSFWALHESSFHWRLYHLGFSPTGD